MKNQDIFPVSVHLRTRAGRFSLGRASMQKLREAQLAAIKAVEARTTLSPRGVKYKANALEGLSAVEAHHMMAMADGLRQYTALKAGWKAPAKKPARSPALPKSSGVQYRTTSPFAASLFKMLPAPRGAGNPFCRGVLRAVESLAATAQNACNTLEQDWAQALPLVIQLQALIAQFQSQNPQVNTDPIATWTQMQSVAQQVDQLLSAMQIQLQIATSAASQAAQWEVPPGCDVGAIDAAKTAAQSAASEASAANNNLGVIIAAAVAQQALSTPKPAPPPPNPITLACLSGSIQTTFFGLVAYEFDLTFSESCTQSLLSALSTITGTPSGINYALDAVKVIMSVWSLTKASTNTIFATLATLGSVVGLIQTLLMVEFSLIEQVINEADVNHNGITMHFSTLPAVAVAAALGEPFLIPAELAGLIAELGTPGGVGNAAFDMFWITGN